MARAERRFWPRVSPSEADGGPGAFGAEAFPTPGWLTPQQVPPVACLAFVSREFTQTAAFPRVAWLRWTRWEKSCKESGLGETSPRPLALADMLAEPAFLLGSVQPQKSEAACVKITVIIWQEGVYIRQGIWGDVYKCAQVNSVTRVCSEQKGSFLAGKLREVKTTV